MIKHKVTCFGSYKATFYVKVYIHNDKVICVIYCQNVDPNLMLSNEYSYFTL